MPDLAIIALPSWICTNIQLIYIETAVRMMLFLLQTGKEGRPVSRCSLISRQFQHG